MVDCRARFVTLLLLSLVPLDVWDMLLGRRGRRIVVVVVPFFLTPDMGLVKVFVGVVLCL